MSVQVAPSKLKRLVLVKLYHDGIINEQSSAFSDIQHLVNEDEWMTLSHAMNYESLFRAVEPYLQEGNIASIASDHYRFASGYAELSEPMKKLIDKVAK